MNLVDCYVTEILYRKETELDGEPWVVYGVTAVSWGREFETILVYPAGEEPKIETGFRFLA